MFRRLRTLLAPLALAACDGDSAPDPAPDHELLTQVEYEDWPSWARAPNNDERKESDAPHGGWVEIYTDDMIVEALANTDGLGLTAWPDGGTIVLAGFADETSEDYVQLAIMQKRHGTWYWEQYDADDRERPRFAGRPDVCVGCHAESSDFVRSFPLPKPVEDE
jgi:hypothetical protein